MTLLAIVFASLVIVLIGRGLVRFLGWPTTSAGAARWGCALLALAVVFSGLPEILRACARALRPIPAVSLAELVPELLVLGLALLGYVGWTRAAEQRADEERRDAQAQTQLRRRALPPAPAELPAATDAAETGFRPRGRSERRAGGAETDA